MAGFEPEPALAVLVDIENLSRPGARNRGDFDIHLVLGRLAEKGRVVVKRAYADWSRYRDARRELMNAGLELIEMPSAREGAKNRADIKMAVDAMEIAYSRTHVTTFVIVSGDSDFTPLIGKLRELNKRVIGIGRDESSASQLLIANCDEFYFYDSMAKKAPRHQDGVRPDALSLLRETMIARQGEGDEHPQASAVKDSMRRRDPAFSESDIGYSTFSKFLEDAQAKGVVHLITDPKSGTYLVQLVDGNSNPEWPSVSDQLAAAAAGETTAETREPSEGRRRRRRRRSGDTPGDAPAEATSGEAADVEDTGEGGGDGAEVFEWKVPEREPELPPIDVPLTYEDILLAPEEASADTTADEPPTRGARRRRKALSSVPEPEVTDLEATDDDATETTAAATDASETEAASTESAEVTTDAEAEAPAEEKPARRGRVKRGSVLPPAESAEETTDAEAEAPAEEKKPTRRRTTRKKATTEDTPPEETPAAEATTEASAEEAPAEEKPKRRRTTRKKATTEDTPPEETPAAEATTEDAPAEEEKPKRRRTTRKKATEDTPAEETPAAEATTEDAPAEEEKPTRRRTTRKKAADDTPSEETPAAEATTEDAPAEEKKPTRRRTTRKKAADDTPSEETPSDE